jgi:hypothetical protein
MAWYDGLKKGAGAILDPLNISGYGGVPAPQNDHRVSSGSLQLAHGGELYNTAQQGYNAAGGRQGQSVTGAQIDQSQQGQFRGQQFDLASALRDRAMGTGGPSAAEMQLRRTTDQNIQAQASAAASGRGGQSALSQYNLANRAAATQQDAAGQAATLRANEQIAAQQSLGALLAQGRGADIELASGQAGLNQQANLANQQAAMTQMGLNDAQQRALLELMYGVDRSNQAGTITAEQINAGIIGNNAAAQAAMQGQVLGTVGQAGGLLASDERLKKDVRLSPEAIDAFMASLDPYTFSYKDPFEGVGERFGILAQDAEGSPMGDKLVSHRPDGMKGLDKDKTIGALLASVARLDERLGKVETKKGRK